MRRAKGRGGAQWRTRQAGEAARGPVSAPGRLNARAALLARPRPVLNLPFRHARANGRCIGKLSDGRLVSYALAPGALEEDCRRAAVVVSVHAAPPPDCGAFVIGRELWRTRGALSLRRDGGERFVIESAGPENFDRP